MQPMKAILGSVLFFAMASVVYVGVLFGAAGRRHAALGLSAILSRTLLNPFYWIAFAITLWIGWMLAARLAH